MKLFTKIALVALLFTAGHANASLINLGAGDNTYGGSAQDISQNSTITGDTISLDGNTWRSIGGNFVITEDTVLSFDFLTSDLGEIHGIGFDNDNNISQNFTFQLGGSQTWGIQDFRVSPLVVNQTYSFTINVGQFYTGTFDRLFFVADEDRAGQTANSTFSNISVVQASAPSVLGIMVLAIAGFAFRRK